MAIIRLMKRRWREIRGRRLLSVLIVIVAVCGVLSCVLWLTAHMARQSAMQQLLRRDEHALQLYVANIRRELSQYAYLPKLLADDRRVSALLRKPNSMQRRRVVNHYLRFVARASDAAVIYAMTRQGKTVASSNWAQADSFIGANYSFRPYFKQAMQGQLGRYYALGSSSFVRGYYFAYPVSVQGRIIGVVAVKVALGSLEMEQNERRYEFVVTGPYGIAFLSTRAQWRYHAFRPLETETRFRLAASQRYVGHALPSLQVSGRRPFGDAATLLTLQQSGTTYLKHGTYMPEAGWWVYILSSTATVERYVAQALVLVTVVFGLLVLAALIFWQRRVRLAERVRYEQATLETAAALDANRRLTREIKEHQRTVVELRRTRDELVQAGKLAAIGQLAAGMNHELNQPLTSIRLFAENAREFLDRARPGEARDNLMQIGALSEHMGKIIHQLKLFARKSSGQLVPVSLTAVVDGAIALLSPRLKRGNVALEWTPPEHDIHCLGDMVRLEQVVVNLISNAIQAMDGLAQPHVEVDVACCEQRAVVTVRDHGTGVADTALGHIFDPFFTTKEEGEGLGLGLSISKRIVEEMEGSLHAGNHAAGGAVFSIDLPIASLREEEHE